MGVWANSLDSPNCPQIGDTPEAFELSVFPIGPPSSERGYGLARRRLLTYPASAAFIDRSKPLEAGA
jgi:hypothetical protein